MNKRGKVDGRGWYALAGLILLCQLTGILGSLITAGSVNTWYAGLNKPFFNPPGWIFGPVWTLLYLMMAFACWLILRVEGAGEMRKRALVLFFLQLAANGIWSLLFFGLQNPALAFVDIFVLWILIILTIRTFLPLSRPAAILLMPYGAWVSFAGILNLSIWWLNR